MTDILDTAIRPEGKTLLVTKEAPLFVTNHEEAPLDVNIVDANYSPPLSPLSGEDAVKIQQETISQKLDTHSFRSEQPVTKEKTSSSIKSLFVAGHTPFPNADALASGRVIPGGTNKSDILIAESIASKGADIDIVSCKGESQAELSWQPKPDSGNITYRHVNGTDAVVDEIIAKQDNYNLIHLSSHVFLDNPQLSDKFWANVRKPVMLTATGAWVFQHATGEMLSKCEKIVCKSEKLKEMALELGVPESKLVVVPNGVDVEKEKPADPEVRRQMRETLGIPQDATVILTAGRISEEKGLDKIADAYEKVFDASADKNIYYIALGKAAHYTQLGQAMEKRLKSMGDKHVITPGWVAPDEYFAAADYVVSCGEREGMSNVILEAAAREKPNIGPAGYSGFEDIIKDQETGFLFDPNNPQNIADTLQKAIDLKRNNGSGYTQVAQNARAFVSKNNSPQAISEQYIGIYKELKDKNSEPSDVQHSEEDITQPATLERNDDELTILRDRALWQKDEEYIVVPSKEDVVDSLKGKDIKQLAEVIKADYEVMVKAYEQLRTDDLTGLKNARGFREEAVAKLPELARKNESFAFLIADLNNMALVNEKFGHNTASAYVEFYARVLEKAMRSDNTLANPNGGDEYAIIASGVTQDNVNSVREHLYQTLREEVAALTSDHPMYPVREFIKLEAAVGVAVVGWTEEEKSILAQKDREKKGELVKDKIHAATTIAEDDLYGEKARQKGIQYEGLAQGAVAKGEAKIRNNDLDLLWTEAIDHLSIPDDAEIIGQIQSQSLEQVADIVIANRERTRRYQHELTTDEKTGLYNKNGFRMKVKERIPSLAREGEAFSFVVGDLAGMKKVNDRFGHPAGDAYIALIGQAIRESQRGKDSMGHPYGDELTGILEGVTTEQSMEICDRYSAKMKELVAALTPDHPLYVARDSLDLNATFGFSRHEWTESELKAFKNAKDKKEVRRLTEKIVVDEFEKADLAMRRKKKEQSQKKVS